MTTGREYRAKPPRADRLGHAASAFRGMFGTPDGGDDEQPCNGPDWLKYVPEGVRDLVRSHLPDGVLDAFGRGSPSAPSDNPRTHTPASRHGGGRFLAASFSNAAGTRPYKVYVPSGYRGQPIPLVVMLHGCTQSPDDFAAGTAMNEAAEEQTFLVAYPEQIAGAHAQKCWKWFSPEDQQRGRGEPSLIAGITHKLIDEYNIDPRRVYAAGLSAGGAAAAIMGDAYPELFAAIGVHSGLACGAAHDLPSALAAMKRGGAGRQRAASEGRSMVPTIVFHGDRDVTVSPRNGEDLIAQCTPSSGITSNVQHGRSEGGRDYTRTTFADRAGQVVTEQWVVHGLGHAWSGGRRAGSFTDPSGPDATNEMLRFFKQHVRTF